MRVDISVYSAKYPVNCVTEGSRLSWCSKAISEVIAEHNATGALYRNGDISREEWLVYKSTTFHNKYFRCVLDEMEKQIRAAKAVAFFKASLQDHIVDDAIVYPGNLDVDNEGSRLSFLCNLWDEVDKIDSSASNPDSKLVSNAFDLARKDAEQSVFWDMGLSMFNASTREATKEDIGMMNKIRRVI